VTNAGVEPEKNVARSVNSKLTAEDGLAWRFVSLLALPSRGLKSRVSGTSAGSEQQKNRNHTEKGETIAAHSKRRWHRALNRLCCETMADRRHTFTAILFPASPARRTTWTGSTPAFVTAAAVILVWIVTGPLFHFQTRGSLSLTQGRPWSPSLMVFLIQARAEPRRSGRAVEARRDRGRAEGASNRSFRVEDLSEEELKILRIHYQRLAEMAKRAEKITESHSIEEAEARHNFKVDRRKKKLLAKS